MGSIRIQTAPLWVAAIVWLGSSAAVAAQTSSAPLSVDAAADLQRQIVARIDVEETLNGPLSEGLISPLSALAELYRDGGDLALASATLERIVQILRVHYGLHSLEQAPLIRQLIANEEAAENFDEAWRLDEWLLTLARRHPLDLRTVPILRDTAYARLGILARYLSGEHPPQVVLGCYYRRLETARPAPTSDGSILDGQRRPFSTYCRSGGRGMAAEALLIDAVAMLEEAAAVVIRNDLYSSEDVRELEMDILRVLRSVPPQSVGWNQRYLTGKRSLERLATYETKAAAPPLRQVEAQVHIADWELLHSRNPAALDAYGALHAQLSSSAAPEGLLEHVFAPDLPVVLPAFEPNPLSSVETPESIGHIDVAFDVTHLGKSRRIEILETTRNATDAQKDRLVRLIERSRFRPRTVDGALARRAPVVVRYYVGE